MKIEISDDELSLLDKALRCYEERGGYDWDVDLSVKKEVTDMAMAGDLVGSIAKFKRFQDAGQMQRRKVCTIMRARLFMAHAEPAASITPPPRCLSRLINRRHEPSPAAN